LIVDNDDPDLASGIFRGMGTLRSGPGSRVRTGPDFTADHLVHAMNTTDEIFGNYGV